MTLISFLDTLNLMPKDKSILASSMTGTLKIDSRSIEPGDVYLVMPVLQENLAKQYQNEAKQRGATFILEVEEPRYLWSQWAKHCYPKQPETCVAVTGTSGKTSVVEFTRQLWQHAGLKAASLGTLGLKSENALVHNIQPKVTLTTPDSFFLHQMLHQLANCDIQHVALEASSHGLDQHRLDQVVWSAAAFTNPTLLLNQTRLKYFQFETNRLRVNLALFFYQKD